VQIVVTTCPEYAHLLEDFDYLFQKFWGADYIVIGKDERRDYADNIIHGLSKLECEYIILLHEDFYIMRLVPIFQIDSLLNYARKYDVKRVSLQCIEDGYAGHICDTDYPFLYKVTSGFQYMCSLEASIWNREFLIGMLKPGENVWETELNCSKRNPDIHVIVPANRVLNYSDARIHGEVRIKLVDGVFHKLIPGDLWESLGIRKE
jgi:hypothetical protein